MKRWRFALLGLGLAYSALRTLEPNHSQTARVASHASPETPISRGLASVPVSTESEAVALRRLRDGIFDTEQTRREAAAKEITKWGAKALVLAPALIFAITHEQGLVASSNMEAALKGMGARLQEYIPLMVGRLTHPVEQRQNPFLISQLADIVRAIDPTNPEMLQALLVYADPSSQEAEAEKGVRGWRQSLALSAIDDLRTDGRRAATKLAELLEKSKRDNRLSLSVVQALLNVDPQHDEGRRFLLDKLLSTEPKDRQLVLITISFIGPGARDTLPYLMEALAGNFLVPEASLALVARAIQNIDPANRRFLDYARTRFEKGNAAVRKQACYIFEGFVKHNTAETEQWRFITQQCPGHREAVDEV